MFNTFSEGKALSDDDVLKDLPVGTTTTMFFQDLGPQLGWAMVTQLILYMSLVRTDIHSNSV